MKITTISRPLNAYMYTLLQCSLKFSRFHTKPHGKHHTFVNNIDKYALQFLTAVINNLLCCP